MDENRSMRFRGQRISVDRALEVNRVYLEGFENGHFQINKLLKTDQKLARIINAPRKKEK